MIFADSLLSTTLPLYASPIAAGFPSPATDYIDRNINLNEFLIAHPESTFILRMSSKSMVGLGIFQNDLLVVDKSLTPKKNDIVVYYLNGNFKVNIFFN